MCLGFYPSFGSQCCSVLTNASAHPLINAPSNLQAIAAFVAFWVVGVPMSAFLGVYLNWGVKGLWGGMAAGELPLFLVYLYLLR